MAGTKKRRLFVLAGGGTGGHLYPGIAAAEELRKLRPEFDIVVYGTPRPIDAKLTESHNMGLVVQQVQPFTTSPKKLYGFVRSYYKSIAAAKKAFTERKPAMVLGLGGYAAAPPIIAASKLGVPTALFNPDLMPGRANRKLADLVDRIFVQWYESIDQFGRVTKAKCTGCPIRAGFATVSKEAAIKALKLDPNKKTLLITGASQGAWSINTAVLELSDFWKSVPDWQIIHLTGANDLKGCRAAYAEAGVTALTLAFTEHMAHCMAAADLIVSRAGASTLAEITAVGRASILMPYPFDKKQHQLANAEHLAKQNAAILVKDANDQQINAKRLRRELESLMASDHRRERLAEIAGAMGRHDAAVSIAKGMIALADGERDDPDE